MSLDAYVYCDCVERGRLRVPPPFPDLLYIDRDGVPAIRSTDIDQLIQHDRWQVDACEHENCVLVTHWLGGGGIVRSLQERLAALCPDPEAEFPIVWKRVIYDSTHCADYIEADDLPALRQEIERARQSNASAPSDWRSEQLEIFVRKMEELVEAALSVRKPIVF